KGSAPMSTSRTLILARRVIQQMMADRRTLALIVVVPVILLSFLGILIRAEAGGLAVGIVNEDEGVTLAGRAVTLGDRLVEVLGDFEEFGAEAMSPGQAERRLEEGSVDAVIFVGPDF